MRPCPFALSLSRVPTKTWKARVDLFERLHGVREAIQSDPGQRWTLAGLARDAGLSTFHFHRLYRKTYGETPATTWQRGRLKQAAKLIQSSKSTISEVAIKVGYASLSSFSRDFRRFHHVSPSELRKLAKLEQLD